MVNSTNDKPRSTTTKQASKESSADVEAATDDPAETPEAEVDPSSCFPGYIRNSGGFEKALEAIENARKTAKLPSLNRKDYRFALRPPGGIPFSVPVEVIYKPGTAKEKVLGTFRVSR